MAAEKRHKLGKENWSQSALDRLTPKGGNMKPNQKLFSVILLLPAFVGLVLWPEESAQAVKEGLNLCAGVIIPALFPFLVLSSLTVSLGLALSLGRLLAPVTRRLFHIGAAGTGALTLGLIGGYPVGARAVRQLWESGQCSYEESVRLLTFCNNCGPSFLLGVAGGTVFHSVKTGCLLWAAHLLGTITVALLTRGYRPAKAASMPDCATQCPVQCVSFARALTGAVQSGLQSTWNICAYVVLFRVILRFCNQVGAENLFRFLPNGAALFGGILELSTGVTALSPQTWGAVPLASFLLGFGGLAVWCQTMAMLDGSGLELWPAFVGKLLHGGCAALWSVLLLRLFPQALPTAAFAGTVMPTVCLSWLPFAVAGGSWGIFGVSLAYFWRISTGKSRQHRV